MILYQGTPFGYGTLFRLHGSAAARAVLPALLSTAMYFIYFHTYATGTFEDQVNWKVSNHPYPITALVTAFTFLLTFRANYSYNRYWEAAGSVHQMLSKWLDAGNTMGAFHMQSARYDRVKPPSFGQHPELKSVVRERERLHRMNASELEGIMEDKDPSMRNRVRKRLGLKPKRKRKMRMLLPTRTINATRSAQQSSSSSQSRLKIPLPPRPRPLVATSKLTSVSRTNGGIDDSTPSLFLQELCHLLSLLSAVAMSTLRNDIEFAESPLTEYIPGDPWPPVDPDELSSVVRKEYDEQRRCVTVFRYLFGHTRTIKHRTLYNAARPFGVLGGVSDAECQLLQSARGPFAKVALCEMWLQEFISREYLNGSTGNVAPPILSRLFQYVSDGMLGYNQARKVAYIPFPFPHAQLTVLYILVLVVMLPFLNLSFANTIWFGALVNFLTILCFAGLHEVARELENPFQNTPNDLPLTTYQAEFNEALVTMYCGFHPDAYWTPSTISQSKLSPPSLPSASLGVPNLGVATYDSEEAEENENEEAKVRTDLHSSEKSKEQTDEAVEMIEYRSSINT